MSKFPITIRAYGRHALLIEWPKEVSEAILKNILQFQDHLSQRLSDNFEKIVAYNSLTLIDLSEEENLDRLTNNIYGWYDELQPSLELKRSLWKLPVCYDEEFGIDLGLVSETLGIDSQEIIKMHTSKSFTVYGIGFLPGFMYLGGLPKALEVLRRKEPRLKVTAGSVGLAGKQTGVYPQNSPGGWQIIGNCPISLFDVMNAKGPCFVNVGDRVQFMPVTKAEHGLYKIRGEVGIIEHLNEVWDG